jgi:hypothetical protein
VLKKYIGSYSYPFFMMAEIILIRLFAFATSYNPNIQQFLTDFRLALCSLTENKKPASSRHPDSYRDGIRRARSG